MKTSEFELLEKIRDLFGEGSANVLVGVGDDAALVGGRPGQVVLTTDTVVEGVHFQRSYFGPFSIGYKAVSAAVSDVAAMAGVPAYCLSSFEIPGHIGADYILKICEGAKQSAGSYDAEVVGGNVSGTGGPLSLTISVVGFCDEGRSVTRAGAKPGDAILVTGDIGASQAGQMLLERGVGSDEREERLCEKHMHPRARVREALALSKTVRLTSMIDISDGLALDLARVCSASSTGAIILEDSLPIMDDTRSVFETHGMDPVLSSISGGEDFELLFTVAENEAESACTALAGIGAAVFAIGSMTPVDEGVYLNRGDGTRLELGRLGYDHFA